jgi:hypothetical protein
MEALLLGSAALFLISCSHSSPAAPSPPTAQASQGGATPTALSATTRASDPCRQLLLDKQRFRDAVHACTPPGVKHFEGPAQKQWFNCMSAHGVDPTSPPDSYWKCNDPSFY